MKTTPSLITLLCASMLLVSCGESAGPVPPIEPDLPESELAALNCRRLDTYWRMVQQAIKESRGDPIFSGTTAGTADSAGLPGEPAIGSESKVVSEADFVQADGNLVFLIRSNPAVAGSSFTTFGVKESGEIMWLDSIELEGTPNEFLYDGHSALVVASQQGPGASYGTILHHLSVADPANLSVIDSRRLKNQRYVTSRLVGDTAHLVLEHPAPFWRGATPPVDEEIASPCGAVFLPDEALNEGRALQYQNVISIVSFSMGEEQMGSMGHSVITASGRPIVSVTPQSVYIGTSPAMEGDSEIFKFSLEGENKQVQFAAQGKVPGRLETAFVEDGYNAQFSMDEHEGMLRVATTSGTLSRTGVSSAESSLFILAQERRELKIIGELRDLHPGEAVYAVRFLDDRGYVVTFKKIDPLFVLDLSDPTHPKKVGELEVPGFSTYLTPIDEKTLLAIGKDADDQGSFAWFGGLKLSLFDVAEPAAPRLIDSVTIGERGTESEALTDHRAFNYFPDRGMLAIPVDLVTEVPYDNGWWRMVGTPDHSEEQIWSVDPVNGFTQLAAIRHDDLLGEPEDDLGCDEWCYTPHLQMRRALEVGQRLLTVSDEALKVSDFGSWEELSSILY